MAYSIRIQIVSLRRKRKRKIRLFADLAKNNETPMWVRIGLSSILEMAIKVPVILPGFQLQVFLFLETYANWVVGKAHFSTLRF